MMQCIALTKQGRGPQCPFQGIYNGLCGMHFHKDKRRPGGIPKIMSGGISVDALRIARENAEKQAMRNRIAELEKYCIALQRENAELRARAERLTLPPRAQAQFERWIDERGQDHE